jgi:hypothetical protein
VLVVGEYLYPSAQNYLPLHEIGHRIVVGRAAKQYFVPGLTPRDIGRGDNSQDVFD